LFLKIVDFKTARIASSRIVFSLAYLNEYIHVKYEISDMALTNQIADSFRVSDN